MCGKCKKRKICKKICNELEKTYLKPLNHSLKSRYLVLFYNSIELAEIEEAQLSLRTNYTTVTEAKKELANYKSEEIRNEVHRGIKLLLNPKQRFCVRHYFGIDGYEMMNQASIAHKLHISQDNVSYNLQKAKQVLYECLFI